MEIFIMALPLTGSRTQLRQFGATNMAEEDNFVGKSLEVSPGLLRQRRNLLIAAVVFLLVRVGGATIQGVSIGGNSIRFERPEVLFLALWVITIYWLLRYLQYLAADAKLWETLGKAFQERRSYYLTKSMNDRDAGPFLTRFDYISMFLLPTPKKKDGKRLVAYAKRSGLEETVPIYSNEISLAKVILHQVRAVAFISLWRPIGTDFFLPVILGVCVLALGLIGNWPGSLGNLWHKVAGY